MAWHHLCHYGDCVNTAIMAIVDHRPLQYPQDPIMTQLTKHYSVQKLCHSCIYEITTPSNFQSFPAPFTEIEYRWSNVFPLYFFDFFFVFLKCQEETVNYAGKHPYICTDLLCPVKYDFVVALLSDDSNRSFIPMCGLLRGFLWLSKKLFSTLCTFK